MHDHAGPYARRGLRPADAARPEHHPPPARTLGRSGYYLERFPQGLRRNLDQCDRVEVIALDGSVGTWLGGLVRGRFATLPAMRLRGHAGARRLATEEEQDRWQRKVRRLRFTKGHGLLWGGMTHARDLCFDAFDPIRLGAMTEGLFPEP